MATEKEDATLSPLVTWDNRRPLASWISRSTWAMVGTGCWISPNAEKVGCWWCQCSWEEEELIGALPADDSMLLVDVPRVSWLAALPPLVRDLFRVSLASSRRAWQIFNQANTNIIPSARNKHINPKYQEKRKEEANRRRTTMLAKKYSSAPAVLLNISWGDSAS
jgi:hypothetical protein